MTVLISLIGEQPIPNLLPMRALDAERNILAFTPTTQRVAINLKAMIPNAELFEIEAYDLTEAVKQTKSLCQSGTIVNLTGGTKPMALAAYEAARSLLLPVVYLQSEGGSSVLYHYGFQNGEPVQVKRETLGTLLNIDDYLLAHGLKPTANQGPVNAQEAGLRHWLEAHVEECRTNLVFEAFELDFVLRRGNRVAVLEAKMKRDNNRTGIDQLNTACGRSYLGTYTGKILAVSKPLGSQLSHLAEARQIKVVHISGQVERRTGRLILSSESQKRLSAILEKALGSATDVWT